MIDELFELLPEEIKHHLTRNGHICSFPHNLNNYLEFMGEGADRTVFALNDDYVVKFETEANSDQNIQEYYTYQDIEDSRVSTKFFTSDELLDMGVLFAERVIPMEDYFFNILGLEFYNVEKRIRIIDYVADFDLSEHGIHFLTEKLEGYIDNDILLELVAFADFAMIYGLQDMHSENIGVAKDGRFLALDLGFGSC